MAPADSGLKLLIIKIKKKKHSKVLLTIAKIYVLSVINNSDQLYMNNSLLYS